MNPQESIAYESKLVYPSYRRRRWSQQREAGRFDHKIGHFVCTRAHMLSLVYIPSQPECKSLISKSDEKIYLNYLDNLSKKAIFSYIA